MKIDAIWTPETQQQLFRSAFRAFAVPAHIHDIGPLLAGRPAWLGVLATLVDGATTLADPDAIVSGQDWDLLQTRRDAPDAAHFVVADGTKAPAFIPSRGTLESPEQGATVILRLPTVGEGDCSWRCSGPGLKAPQQLALSGIDSAWFVERLDWNATFPLGVDLLLCDEQRIAALPRTTSLTVEEA
jgi:alpha-D-ribose 1-methylphosphonate 5-triphosphate synthase subunit PhnH